MAATPRVKLLTDYVYSEPWAASQDTIRAEIDGSIKEVFDNLSAEIEGVQTVENIKTFTVSPIVPTPTTDFQASTKKYVDNGLSANQSGDHLGTWHGMEPSASEPGIQGVVNGHTEQLADIAGRSGLTYNLINYMIGGKTSIEAMTDIIALINGSAASSYTIYLPTGTYDFTTITTPYIILKDNVQIIGDGKCGSIINVYQNKLFQWGNATVLAIGGGITNIKFVSPLAPANSQCCIYLFWGASQVFDVQVYNINQLLVMTPTTTSVNYSTGCNITVNGMKYNNGNPMFILNKGAGFWLKGNTYVGGVTLAVHGSAMSTIAGCDLIYIAGAFDSIFVSGLHERYFRNIIGIASAGVVIQNINTDAWFDYTRSSCIIMSTTGGVISAVHIKDGSWLCSWEYDAVQFDCQSGSIQDINIINSKIPISGGIGINCNNVNRLNILGNLIGGVGQVGGTNTAIYVHGTGAKVYIVGNRLVDSTAAGIPWGTTPQINVTSGIDNLIVKDNDVYGIAIGAFATASKNRTCKDNIMSAVGTEMNYSGARTDIFPLPVSGATFTNVYPYDFEIFIYGGTIQDIVKNNYQICVGSPVSFTCMVKSGETFVIDYTVAPTWKVFVRQ